MIRISLFGNQKCKIAYLLISARKHSSGKRFVIALGIQLERITTFFYISFRSITYLILEIGMASLIHTAPSSSQSSTMVGYGASYSPKEDSSLARAWVSVSSKHDEQNAFEFWA